MTNKWGIPDWLKAKVRKKDKKCVYCHVELKEYPQTKSSPRDKATWEHIDNDSSNKSEKNIVRCCNACSAGKETKSLSVWLRSEYCREKISKKTIRIPGS